MKQKRERKKKIDKNIGHIQAQRAYKVNSTKGMHMYVVYLHQQCFDCCVKLKFETQIHA